MDKMNIRIVLFFVFIIPNLFSCKSGKEPSSTETNKTAQVFDELWQLFEEHYAFFELRNVDWEAEKELFLSSNHNIESDSILFEKLCDLLKKFDDTHINLESDSLNKYCNAGKMPDFYHEFPSNEAFGLFLKARDNTLQGIGINEVVESKSKIFQFGRSNNQDWGYLRIKRFYGASLEEIRLELDEIIKTLKKVKSLILDIRVNPGGNDETALLSAGYFFKENEIGFIKTVRNGKGYEDFSEPDTTYIIANEEIQSESENIYLLTNRASGSSADVFALVMSYLPNVTIVGQNTEGIFSNMHRDTLSNSWRVTLSNERYFSKDMKCYEKIGVPVDIEANNKMEEVKKGIDKVIQVAVDSQKN